MNNIRLAEIKDIPKIENLLEQVLKVHHNVWPDIFKANGKKYSNEELIKMLDDSNKPIFVATDENDDILGYVFCIFKQQKNSDILTDIKTLFIDDLCIEKTARGQNIGKNLYNFAKKFAKEQGCYNLTLNVWADNEKAVKFYEKMEMKPQKFVFETIL